MQRQLGIFVAFYQKEMLALKNNLLLVGLNEIYLWNLWTILTFPVSEAVSNLLRNSMNDTANELTDTANKPAMLMSHRRVSADGRSTE